MRCGKGGVSLVELLVVIAIISIMIALLLPALQAARERARRMSCTNNLKQVGLAVLQYEGSHASFPPGNIITDDGADPKYTVNWMISILPYVEQKSLYAAFDFNAPSESPTNQLAREASVPPYVCPSDAATDEPAVPAEGPAARQAMNLAYMPGSYRAVSGRSDGTRYLDSGDLSTYPKQWRGIIHAVGPSGFTAERRRTLRDGSSNTLMAGESTTRTRQGFRTFWAYPYAYFTLSAATTGQSRTLCGDYDRCATEGGTGGDRPCKRGWGSYHPQGMNFAVCDGSVRFLPATIDMETLARLSTIEGRDFGQVPH
jgi:prepilin-type N-terminal cleavage/methylation domain-containing protein